MVEKVGDVVVVSDDKDDLAAVLREIGLPDGLDPADPKLIAALQETLQTLADHPVNQVQGQPSAFIKGTRVHFRFKKTVYSGLTGTARLVLSALAVAADPVLGGANFVVRAADEIRNIANHFKRLNPQEFMAVEALREASKEKKGATSSEVETVFIQNNTAPPAVPATLAKLVNDGVLIAEPRDGDIYYSIVF